MTRDVRASVNKADAVAAALGYHVRESDCRHIDGTVSLDVEGYGQLIEVVFRVNPVTGYHRFHHGFIHHGLNGDVIPTWAKVQDTLMSCRNVAVAFPGK